MTDHDTQNKYLFGLMERRNVCRQRTKAVLTKEMCLFKKPALISKVTWMNFEAEEHPNEVWL